MKFVLLSRRKKNSAMKFKYEFKSFSTYLPLKSRTLLPAMDNLPKAIVIELPILSVQNSLHFSNRP